MSIKYRPEIDGLRSIAVLSVVLYHAEISVGGHRFLAGGFLGVDIFFVISGFLITSIILNEVAQKTFSFASFYERRARRILPALFVVMLTSLPFAWWLLLPAELQDYASSVLSSLLFGSNFWFWLGDDYWAAESSLRPFLHTWSLSVEEQFYVLLPIIVLLIWSYARSALKPVLIGIFVVSLVLADFASKSSPQTAFYLVTTRAWELMAGALIAKLEIDNGSATHSKRSDVFAGLGLLLIVLSICYFDSSIRHPSGYTVLPILGTVLLVRYAVQGGVVARLLSTRIMVGIGLISYSLYLWHFPIFSFALHHYDEITHSQKGFNIGLSFLLATLTYFLIEKFTRNKTVFRTPYFIAVISIFFVALVGVHSMLLVNKGYPDRFVDFAKLIEYEKFDYEESFLSHTCFLHPEDLEAEIGFSRCPDIGLTDGLTATSTAGATSSKNEVPTLLLWGDSNAAHLIPGIKKHYGKDYRIIIRTISGCGAFIGFEVPRRYKCRELNDQILALATDLKPDKLIIAGLWKIEFPELLAKTLELLNSNGVENVAVIGPVPRWQKSLPRSLIRYSLENQSKKRMPNYLTDSRHQEVFTVEAALRETVLAHNIDYYSILDFVCQPPTQDQVTGACLTNVGNNQLIQWDYGHLTSVGSEYVIGKLRSQGL